MSGVESIADVGNVFDPWIKIWTHGCHNPVPEELRTESQTVFGPWGSRGLSDHKSMGWVYKNCIDPTSSSIVGEA